MKTIGLLIISNIFMTIACCCLLRFTNTALWKVKLIRWLIAFVEYVFMAPANRTGHIKDVIKYQ